MASKERRCTFIIQRGKRKDKACNKKGCRWDKDKCLNHWRFENQLMDDINRTIKSFEPELVEKTEPPQVEEELCAGTTPFTAGSLPIPEEEGRPQDPFLTPFQNAPPPPSEEVFSDTEDEGAARREFDEGAVVDIMQCLRQKRREALGVA